MDMVTTNDKKILVCESFTDTKCSYTRFGNL